MAGIAGRKIAVLATDGKADMPDRCLSARARGSMP